MREYITIVADLCVCKPKKQYNLRYNNNQFIYITKFLRMGFNYCRTQISEIHYMCSSQGIASLIQDITLQYNLKRR